MSAAPKIETPAEAVSALGTGRGCGWVIDAHMFIVHAHRDPASLPGALTDLGVEVLLGAGHRGRFPPVLSVLNQMWSKPRLCSHLPPKVHYSPGGR